MAFGKMLYRDPTFWKGNNGTAVYNNSGNGMVTITREQDTAAPNDSKLRTEDTDQGYGQPRQRGILFRNDLQLAQGTGRPYHRQDTGRTQHLLGDQQHRTGGSAAGSPPRAGTGDWKEYIYKVVCGTSNFSSTHYFYIDGAQGTASTPLTWYVAYATVFDLTSTEKYTTTIDANGVYTGTVKANQINRGQCVGGWRKFLLTEVSPVNGMRTTLSK